MVGNLFGFARFSLGSVQDLDGDGRRDLSIATATDRVELGRVWIFGSQTIATATAPLAASQRRFEIVAPTPGNTTSTSGFGNVVLGGVNLQDSSASDIAVGSPILGKLYIYHAVSGTSAGTAVEIQGPGRFGRQVVTGDINGDGRPDLVVAEEYLSSATAGWVLYGKATGFDASLNGSQPGPMISVFRGTVVGSRRGQVNALGNVAGDSKLEVIVTDENSSLVEVWR